ncbi:hypothetical protein DTL42_17810 [Bremerella cremea]|uniref:Uncharacterized protein n=1 Tax=Bremerella cremea TaxID=1031537 RepID=A0A368KR49_9BACT|nr:hypothetical protein [Bremerella cremea]RCS44769.1 hypothetical protein DTL42_17810 [Bremerella cremea]
MRFSLADLLVVVVVLCVFLAANTIEREGRFIMRKGQLIIMDIRYTYYGFPMGAYWDDEERFYWKPLGIAGNSLLAVAACGVTVFAFRIVRRKLFPRHQPNEEPSAVEDIGRRFPP